MDYRCPLCGKDLGSRKNINAIIARMEEDCRFCNGRLRLNMHPLENQVVFASFGAFAVLALLAWATRSESLTVLALFAGAAIPVDGGLTAQ